MKPLKFLSAPVVQNPTHDGFGVSWLVSDLATAWVEWGYTAELGQKSVNSHHGLIDVDELFLSVRVKDVQPKKEVYYRVASMPVFYHNAYEIETGEAIFSEVYKISLVDIEAESFSMTVTNDTHENLQTMQQFVKRVQEIKPNFNLWNGDTCHSFNNEIQLAQTLMNPAQETNFTVSPGWAAECPLLFLTGNHESRGRWARSLVKAMTPWTEDMGPLVQGHSQYYFAMRHGPVALIGLETGEDKPDQKEVFAQMADYEAYRIAQTSWLKEILTHPDIASAPFLIAVTHIPLRPIEGRNDGQVKEGFAHYSGQCNQLWTDLLTNSGCQLILGGHQHKFTYAKADGIFSLNQVVGGGNDPEFATLIQLHADNKSLTLKVEDINQKILLEKSFSPRI